MNAQYIGIDLFSGAGGLSLGATWAGITTSYAVEFNPSAAETYQKNHPACIVLKNDISKITDKDMSLKRPFVIFGGPPCQGFSASNQKTRTAENPKNWLYKQFLRIVQAHMPQWVVFENVQGIKGFQKGQIVDAITKSLERKDYTVRTAILDAADFGVPQFRKRFFLIANRAGIDFHFPDTLQQPKISVKDAIGDLPSLQNGENSDTLPYKNAHGSSYAMRLRDTSTHATQNFVSRNKDYVIERYAYIAQGQNWQAIPARLMKNYTDKTKCHSGIYRRLLADEPSVVISNYRKNMLIHPFEDRGLSVREAARLQSFPDTFTFCGTISEMQQQIGNAVPPLLAEAVFKRILDYEK
ncbi:cytosine-specific methyltransferase [Spirochaetia bacterium]|nr:cytosine-specific methyltransferase [Spirochaetia bacterium]